MQALKSLGEKNISKQEIEQIHKLVSEETQKEAFKQDLSLMPIWMRKLIMNIFNTLNLYLNN